MEDKPTMLLHVSDKKYIYDQSDMNEIDKGIPMNRKMIMFLSISILIGTSSMILIQWVDDVSAYNMEENNSNDDWIKRGYDDHYSFHYKRPSTEFQPPDTPFEPLWETSIDVNFTGSRWQWAFTGNLDEDPARETVCLNGDRFFAIDDNGDEIFNHEKPTRSTLNLVEDVDGDGISEIFVSIKGVENETTPRIDVFDRFGKLIESFPFTNLRGQPLNDGSPEVWAVKDIDNDGEKEVIVALHASYDMYPRGVVCIGYESWKIEWNYRFATHISNMIFPDLDGDGISEIVFGTSASKNGAVILGSHSNDFNSYIVRLDYNGLIYSEKWRYQLPHDMFDPMYFHTMVSSIDYDNDGTLDIIGYLGDKIPEESQDHGLVFILDSGTGKMVKEYKTPYQYVRPAGFADIDNDGHTEAILQGDMISAESNDYLAVFDLVDWEIETAIEVPETDDDQLSFIPIGINDINGNGYLEIIICSVMTGRVTVLDNQLNEIWHHYSGRTFGSAVLCDILPEGVNEILMISNRPCLLTLEMDIGLKRHMPSEREIVLFPGEELELEVEIVNNGDLVWMVELSLLEKVEENMNRLDRKLVWTPDPGDKGIIGFKYTPEYNRNVSQYMIVLNFTEWDDGIRSYTQLISWDVFVIGEEFLKEMIEIIWDCPSHACTNESICVNGTIFSRFHEKFEFENRMQNAVENRFGELVVGVELDQRSYSIEIPLTGGDFEFDLVTPDEPGIYSIDLNVSNEREKTMVSDSRDIFIDQDSTTSRVKSSVIAIVMISSVIGLSSVWVVIRKVKKKHLIPFLPLFSRDINIKRNKTRTDIYNLITDNPGITPQQIRQKLGIKNYNTVRHHIVKLEEKEMIITKKDSNRPRLILCYPDDGIRIDAFYISKVEKELLVVIYNNPGIKRRDLIYFWLKSQPYLSKCLTELSEKGIIHIDHNYRIWVTEEFREYVSEIKEKGNN